MAKEAKEKEKVQEVSEKPTTAEAPVTGIAEAPKSEVATSMEDMMLANAGLGLNNLGANDLSIPFLTIVQKGSPQASRANAKYIKGCEQGQIMNTVTQDLYPGEEGILFIPCGYQKQMVRWGNRDLGGGLVCQYKEGDPELKKLKLNDRGQLWDPESKDVILDTAYHFGLLMNSDMPEYAVISMYSTQLKASRNWNTMMKRIMMKAPNGKVFNPPSFSHQYRLTTLGQTKDTYDWFGWKIISEGQVTDPEIFKVALEFAKQVDSGLVRVSAPPRDVDESDDVVTKEDVPF